MSVPVLSRFPDVMLLAAGQGTRLRPLTLSRPKPLVEIAGTTLLDRVIATAVAEGARRFVVNAHAHAGQIVVHAAALRAKGLDIAVSDESAGLLDTGGGLRRALPLLATDPVLVMNTDAFWPAGADKPLGRMVSRLDPSTGIVLLCVQPRRATGFRRSHDFCLDPKGQVTADTGAPVIYAGVALIRRGLVEAVNEETFSLNRLFEAARDSSALAGVVLDAHWMHVGDPEALREGEAVLKGLAS